MRAGAAGVQVEAVELYGYSTSGSVELPSTHSQDEDGEYHCVCVYLPCVYKCALPAVFLYMRAAPLCMLSLRESLSN